MTQDIVIVGAGGLAHEIEFLIEEINEPHKPEVVLFNPEPSRWRFVGFIEQSDEPWLLARTEPIAAVIAIGTPSVIRDVHHRLRVNPNITFPNLVHPNVVLNPHLVTLGEGNLVCPGNMLTTNIRFGSFNILNMSGTYGHDLVVGDYCVFNPGVNISGGVVYEDACLTGSGATVLQYRTVHANATIGAGAVVTHDVEAGITVVGVPARPMRERVGAA